MRKAIIILAAAAMTGCGIYKPYTRPEVVTDGLYGDAETADTTTLGDISWQEMFTDPALQKKMFSALGLSDEEAQTKFGFLTDAFKYGAPPHGGMGLGLDRLVMIMLGGKSIRDVVAFPKVQNMSELMTECPSPVDNAQLEELHIAVTEKE